MLSAAQVDGKDMPFVLLVLVGCWFVGHMISTQGGWSRSVLLSIDPEAASVSHFENILANFHGNRADEGPVVDLVRMCTSSPIPPEPKPGLKTRTRSHSP